MSDECKKKRCRKCDEVVICTPENPRPKCKCNSSPSPPCNNDTVNCGCNCIVVGRGPPNNCNPPNPKQRQIYIDELTGLWYMLYGERWAVLPMPCIV